MNTREDANKLVKYLEDNKIHSKIIGSLEYKTESSHDIDIVITNPSDSTFLRFTLRRLLSNSNSRIVFTEWDGIFFYDTYFGNVDIFFKMPRIGAIEA